MRAPLAALLLATACGYSAGLSLRDEGVATVAVRVVANDTYRQRLEIPLTRELNEALSRHANVVTASPKDADALLVVEIVDIQGRSLSSGGSAPIKEGALEFAVRARLLRNPGGAVLRDRRIADRAEFRVPVGENLATASREAIADLARKIVLSLEPDF